MSKEFNRRDFLKTASVFGLAVITGYLGETTTGHSSPFWETRATMPDVFIDELASHVSIPKPQLLHLTTPEGTITTLVGVNKRTFAKALIFGSQFAESESPDQILAILKKRPLLINISNRSPRLLSSNGTNFLSDATYKPRIAGGPEITFYNYFVAEYYQAVTQVDLNSQVTVDQLVLHEIAHFLRDVDMPLHLGFEAAAAESQILVGKIPHFPNYDWGKDPQEIAADVKSQAMVAKMHADFFKTLDLDSWPFGKFFTFQK